MTTVIPFTPSNISAPSFTATLDGSDYTVVVTWNVSSQRYFINIYDLSGAWITTVPLVSSPIGIAVDALTYDPTQGIVTVTKRTPVWHRPGTIIRYWLQGFLPAVLNGRYRCISVDQYTFTFPLTPDPGPISILGSVHWRNNMVFGLFQNSTMIYRNGAFEVDP